jgi:putative endonuclease
VERQPCVYILANGRHGTLYIGVTSDLMARLHQHREGSIKGFTSRYGITRLVWFAMADTMEAAITREKQLKKWNRDWKVRLIEEDNPVWDDLAVGLGFDARPSVSFPRRDFPAETAGHRDNDGVA